MRFYLISKKNFIHYEKLTAIVTVSASSKLSLSGKNFMSPANKYKLYITKHVYEHVIYYVKVDI